MFFGFAVFLEFFVFVELHGTRVAPEETWSALGSSSTDGQVNVLEGPAAGEENFLAILAHKARHLALLVVLQVFVQVKLTHKLSPTLHAQKQS
jgi:hypothetical protein